MHGYMCYWCYWCYWRYWPLTVSRLVVAPWRYIVLPGLPMNVRGCLILLRGWVMKIWQPPMSLTQFGNSQE
ncbi:MAG: hypothetical protein IJT98_03905 [Prevotella sp.]|nr:hypothetical protein [Prevotella sp.]